MSESKPAKLPGLPAVTDANIAQVVRLLAERSEVREGARGSDLERVVTQRDLRAANFIQGGGSNRGGSGRSGGVLVQNGDGTFSSMSVDAFGDEIRKTKLYTSLTKRLDDVTRFDDVPEKVRKLLLNDIASEAAKRGADIQRVEYKLQTAEESIAYTLQEVTAAVANASAGVREVTYASATANKATAGKVTQIQARLDDVGGVTVETALTATADKVTGLEGQYTVKINAGGAVAGFGLAATESLAGATTSSFIVQADQFSLIGAVDYSQATMPTVAAIGKTWYKTDTKIYYRAAIANPTVIGAGGWLAFTPAIPFGVDTVTNTVFINGNVRINAGGPTIEEGIEGPPGSPGSPGGDGKRGTRQLYGTSASYVSGYGYAAQATALIAAATAGSTPTTPIKGDTVTFTNGSTYTYTLTCTADGSNWAAPGVVIDGSLLVTGSVTATQIISNGITRTAFVQSRPHQEVTSTTFTTVASLVFTVKLGQSVMVWASYGMSGARVQAGGTFYDGSYWVNTTSASDCVSQVHLTNTVTAAEIASPENVSLTVMPGVTHAGQVAWVGSNVSPGTYTVALKLKKFTSSQENFAVRDIVLTVLETQR